MTETPAVKHRITPLEWIGVGAGGVAVVASFMPWYTLSGTLVDEQRNLGLRTSLSAWGAYFLGWFPIVLLVAVAVLIVGQMFSRRLPMLASLWLTLALLATVMILLRWITVPDATEFTGRGEDYAQFHAGFGLYLGLAAAVVSGVGGFLTFRVHQRTTRATGANG
ncbi:MAG: hypothetical protein ABW215_18910 [Kibdelosporangium sp.]